jgi:hypothetical protein
MSSSVEYPHGPCECTSGVAGGCSCSFGQPGPAAFKVKRGDKEMKVCTRCDLPGDDRSLLVTREDDATVFSDWDILGFISLCGMLEDK